MELQLSIKLTIIITKAEQVENEAPDVGEGAVEEPPRPSTPSDTDEIGKFLLASYIAFCLITSYKTFQLFVLH